MAKCLCCNKEFKSIRDNHKYCCKKCQKNSGYLKRKHDDQFIQKCICKGCGKEFGINKERLRKYKTGKDKLEYCSRKCAYENIRDWSNSPLIKNKSIGNKKPKYSKIYPVKCEICGKLFIGRNKQTYICSRECRLEAGRRYNKEFNRGRYFGREHKCSWCDKIFIPKYGSKLRSFCSKTCSIKSQRFDKHHSRSHKVQNKVYQRRLRQNNRIPNYEAKRKELFLEIYFRDHGKCQICGKKVKLKFKAPHIASGTLDHIIPLAKDGLHERKNLQLAHFRCNSIKQDKLMGQLRLFG